MRSRPTPRVIDPFEKGADAQTTAEFTGARWVRGNADVNFNSFPERRPALAFDGGAGTAWIPSAFLRQGQRPFLDVGFLSPRDVREIELLPYGDTRGRPVEVRVAGREYRLRAGWNRLAVDLRDVSSLRVTISRSVAPRIKGGPGGIRELRIPGFRPRERLRAPVLSARALRGAPLGSAGLSVIAERTTSWLPWRRNPPGPQLQELDPRDRADFEERIERVVELPAARRFSADAWVSPGIDTPDAVLDRLAGVRQPAPLQLLGPLRGRAAATSRERIRRRPRERLDRRLAAGPPGLAGLGDRGAHSPFLLPARAGPGSRCRNPRASAWSTTAAARRYST